MTWPTIFANLAGGNQSLGVFDAMFNQVAQMVAIPSTPAGTNAITLTPIGNAPALTAYQNFSTFRFIAGATTTGLVTAQYQALGFLPVYLSDGVTQAGNGNIVLNLEYVLVFAQFLNGGAGGFFLEQATIPAITPTAGSAFSNLVITNNTGNPTTQANVTYDELVMNNPSGAPLRATGQSFTINSAVSGVVNGLDVGTLANQTWYAVWGISNGATNGGLFSLSFTNPTMPTGYTFKKRIGAMRTFSTANLEPSIQRGNEAQWIVGGASPFTSVWNSLIQASSGTFSVTSPAYTSVSLGGGVPPTATKIRLTLATRFGSGSAGDVLVAPNVNWGGTNQGPQGINNQSTPVWLPASITPGISMTFELLLETAAVAYTSNGGANLQALGWRDNLN